MISPKTPPNENERQAALVSYNILDTLPEESFDDLTLIASQICQTPIALISLVDNDRQWFKSKYGLPADETHRDLSFCGHAINNPYDILEVNNAIEDHRFHDNPLVTGDPNIRFYAGVPLLDGENIALGTLCVIDTQPKTLTNEQKKALSSLAREVMNRLRLYKRNRQLKKESRRYLVNLNQISGMIFEADMNMNFTFVNQFMEDSFFLKQAKWSKKNFSSLIHPEDLRSVLSIVKNIQEEKVTELNFENRIINGLNQIRWVHQNLKLVEEGQEKHIIGYLRDITDEKEFAKTLQEKSYLLTQSEKLAKVGHWEFNLENNSLFWSDETKRIHEVPINYRPSLKSAIDFYAEEFRPVISEAIKGATEKGENWDLTLQIITAKGQRKWVRAIGKTYMVNDQLNKLIGVFQDINEEKLSADKLLQREQQINKLNKELESKVELRTKELNESNEKYQKLYHEAPDMMLSIDPTDRKILDCNKTTEVKLGYSRSELIGQDVFNFYHPTCMNDVMKAFNAFHLHGKIENKKLIVESKKGERIYVTLNTNAIKNKAGKIVRTNSTWRDISALKKAENQLNELNKQLETKVAQRTRELEVAHEELEDFTYITTHDIKSPLSNIIGYANVLESLLEEEQEEEMIAKSIYWIKSLTNQALSKVGSVIEVVKAKQPAAQELLNVNELIAEIAKSHLRDNEDVEININLKSKIVVNFNLNHLESIISNLIENAIKYRKPNEKLVLNISSRKIMNRTILSFEDNGLGIDLKTSKKKMFKMFSRVHDHVEGTGMGLYLIKKILETAGGKIIVNSELGKGSTFLVTI